MRYAWPWSFLFILPFFFKKKYSFVLLTVDVEFHNLWISIHGASMYVSL